MKRIRTLVFSALLGALLLVVQVVLAPLPNVELVSLLVLLYTLEFPRQTPGAIGVFVVLEGLVYGFGLWWVMYLYLWPLLALVVWLLRKNTSVLLWAVVLGSFGLCFGMLCAIPYALAGGIAAGIAYWISGIPFDLAHCVGNFLLTLALYRPMRSALQQIRKNLG